MNILGIRREAAFSPNREQADAAIFEAVAARLAAHGHGVVRLPEGAVEAQLEQADAFFTMARSAKALGPLKEELTRRPRLCVNHPDGICICADRQQLHRRMEAVGVPHPRTTFASIRSDGGAAGGRSISALLAQASYPLWMKRVRGHTEVREDVVLAADAATALRVAGDFYSRGESLLALCEHVRGDLVKFYGVAGTGFFDWDYADPAQSKFGQELANDSIRRYAFDAEALRAACEVLAADVGVPVYGGDTIVRPDGSFAVIDFNDWPSFGRCRERAADAIVQLFEK